MKAELKEDGHIRITVDTIAEEYALKFLMPTPVEFCSKCRQATVLIIIHSTLMDLMEDT